jgi:3-isopropylmalate dehydrogenase
MSTASRSPYRIAVVAGDGIGPEVTDEALRALEASAELEGFSYEIVTYPWSAEHYLAHGEVMPDSVLSEYREMDAILLGAIGDPRVEVGLLERGIVGGIRWKLDLYINLRPVKLYSESLCPLKEVRKEDVDMVFVRENTEGLYSQVFGFFRKGTPDEIATQEMIHTRMGVERAVRYAFELARKRNRSNKVTLVDKANAVRSMDLWQRTFEEVGTSSYPDIERDHAYIDAACMWMVKNPEWFDVAVTENMFGDIITDLGAMIQGGMGIAASGNIRPEELAMFEPIHGSAPKYAGKGVACPIAAIAAVQMMLEFLGEANGAARLEGAVAGALDSGRIPSLSSSSGMPTSRYTDIVLEELKKTGSPA